MTPNEHVYAICCRSEVAGDVIFSENERTIEGYAMLNFEHSIRIRVSLNNGARKDVNLKP